MRSVIFKIIGRYFFVKEQYVKYRSANCGNGSSELPLLFGVDGVWCAMIATEVFACVIAVIFFIAFRKKYRYS